jgi:succinate dehydrogenase / fumarate reductase, cytochrome b subunit
VIGYFGSAIGRKQLMALTGLIWSGFVFTHMLANMLILFSADAYNKYSHALVSNPLIYLAEALLVLTLALHIFYGLKLTFENRRAKALKSAMPTNGPKAPRFQSKYMAYHGSLILAFVVLHLATFKYGTHYTTTVDGIEMRDLHRLVLEVFQSPGYVAWYLIALVFVGLHLSHGLWSSLSTLGFYHPERSKTLNVIGYLYAAVVAIGFMSQPIYVMFFAHSAAGGQ